MDRPALMFNISPRLADAYRLKNEFLAVLRIISSAEGRKKLADWLLSAKVMDIPEFYSFTNDYCNWLKRL